MTTRIMSTAIYIEDYSAKSFVVRGETRECKESLKALGGKWNSSLTDKETGDKFGAWLFWSDKRKELDAWLDKGCSEVESTHGTKEPTRAISNSGDRQIIARLERMEEMMEEMMEMLSGVCVGYAYKPPSRQSPTKAKAVKKETASAPSRTKEVVLEEEDDDIPVTPPKRLLGAKRLVVRKK